MDGGCSSPTTLGVVPATCRPASQWADQWLATVVNPRPSTRRIYETNLRRHVLAKVGGVELGPMRLTSITTEVARAWLAALTVELMTRTNSRTGQVTVLTHIDPTTGTAVPRVLAPASVHQAYRTLNAVMQAAVECDRIVKNPMTAVKPPKVEQVPMRFLTAVEVMRLAGEIGPEYRALVLVAAFCGLRRGELGGLRWADVDMLRRRIDVVQQLDADTGAVAPLKTKASRRTVTMPGIV